MDNQNSRKIEQLADRLRNDNNKDNLNLLVKELEQGTLYVPAAIPPGTDPALIRQLFSASCRITECGGQTLSSCIYNTEAGREGRPAVSSAFNDAIYKLS